MHTVDKYFVVLYRTVAILEIDLTESYAFDLGAEKGNARAPLNDAPSQAAVLMGGTGSPAGLRHSLRLRKLNYR